MTIEEQDCRRIIQTAKGNAKEALLRLEPRPQEPIAIALLGLIDACDVAMKALTDRIDAIENIGRV